MNERYEKLIMDANRNAKFLDLKTGNELFMKY